MRRPALRRPGTLVVLLTVAAALLRRRTRAGQADKDLWTEATAAPDLR